MSGNRDELPPERPQRDPTTRSDQLAERERLADELGVSPENISTTDTINDGVQARLTEAGRQEAQQTLRERFAEQRPNVTPADVTASVDPDSLTGRAELADDRRDQVRSRVKQAIADDTQAVDPSDIGVSLGAGGVEDVDVDARQVAIEQAASQSERFNADDFQTVDTDDGFETRLTESARERATEAQAEALRQEAAESLDAFGTGDIAVEETDSGLEASVEDSALREQVIEQAQSSFEFANPSREDISVEITDDGASASIADDVRRQEALQQAADQLDAFGTEDITLTQTDDGGFEASVPESIQRETVREQAAAELDDFGPSDITVEETEDGFEASVPEAAQREAVRDQAASELEGFSESDITVSETDDGFRADVTDEAQRREVREEVFADLPDDLSVEQQFANPSTGEITRAGVQRAEQAFNDGELDRGEIQGIVDAFESDETVISEENQIPVPTTDPDEVQVQLPAEGSEPDTPAVGDRSEPRQPPGPSEGVSAAQSGVRVSLTESARSEREQLIRENLRDSAAADLENFGGEDIQITETDEGLQAEVRPESERDFLLGETSETLFVTAAGGDTLQAAIDLRPDLRSIPGRDSINAALEDSGSDARSTAPVGQILQELDPQAVAERQDDLAITPEQVREAQAGIAEERQQAGSDPDAFVEDIDDLDLTDALQFDNATERGSARRSQLRQRAEQIEQEAASDAGVDADEVTFRATVDGLEATEETQRTIARGRAAQQFGVDASNVVVEESGDSFEASLETDFAEAQALQQAASETGIDVDLLDAEASGGSVDVGIDRDALRQSVADEQGVSVGNVELRETETGFEAGINEEVREARVEREIAGNREGVSVGDVDADLDSAFDDSASVSVRADDPTGGVRGAQGITLSGIQDRGDSFGAGDDFGRIEDFGGANFREETAFRSAAEGLAETGAEIGSETTGALLDAAGADPGPDTEFLRRVGASLGAAPGGAAVFGVDAAQAGDAVIGTSIRQGPIAGDRRAQDIVADSANTAISGVDQTFDVDPERRREGEGTLVEIEPGQNTAAAVTATTGALSLAGGAVGGSIARAGLTRGSRAVRQVDVDDVTPDRSFLDDTRAQSQLRRQRRDTDTDAATRTDADADSSAVELDLDRLEDVDLDDISDADRRLLEQVTDQDLDELADTSTSTTTTGEVAAVRQLDTRATAAGAFAPIAGGDDVAAELGDTETDLGVDLAALDDATASVSDGTTPVGEQTTQFTESVETVRQEAVGETSPQPVRSEVDTRSESLTTTTTAFGGVASNAEQDALEARRTALEATQTAATTDTVASEAETFETAQADVFDTTTTTVTDTITDTELTTDTVTRTDQATTFATDTFSTNTTTGTDRPGRPRDLDLPGLDPVDTEPPTGGFVSDAGLFDSGISSSSEVLDGEAFGDPFSL